MDNRLKELEADPIQHYQELNEIYASMQLTDKSTLDKYDFSYLIKFKSTSDYIIHKFKIMMANDTIIEHKPVYLYNIMAVSLFSNNLDQYNQIMYEREQIDVSGTSLGLDFKPISNLVILEESEFVTFLADDQANLNVCRTLITGMTKIIKEGFTKFFPKPHVFLLRGTGPSPYYKLLNCAFLMIGHYLGTEYERKIFSTSVPHELTHLVHGAYQKVKVPQDIQNIYKFFDEGLAVQNSYLFLADNERYFTKFRNTAYIVHKFSKFSTLDIMQNWSVISFQEGQIPTYDYACAFINFIDTLFPSKKCKDFLREWLSQTEITSILEYFILFYQIDIVTADVKWCAQLIDFSPSSTCLQMTNIKLLKREEDEFTFQYSSDFDLWIDTDFFCISKGKIISILPIDNSGIRFRKSSNFKINVTADEISDVYFIVLFMNNVEIIKPTGIT